MCNLNVIVVLEFISRDLYLLFAIGFSSKFQNSVFYQHMRPKSGVKFPRPLLLQGVFCYLIYRLNLYPDFISPDFCYMVSNLIFHFFQPYL